MLCVEQAPIPPLTGMQEFEHKVMDARGLGQRSSACRSRRDVEDVERDHACGGSYSRGADGTRFS